MMCGASRGGLLPAPAGQGGAELRGAIAVRRGAVGPGDVGIGANEGDDAGRAVYLGGVHAVREPGGGVGGQGAVGQGEVGDAAAGQRVGAAGGT